MVTHEMGRERVELADGILRHRGAKIVEFALSEIATVTYYVTGLGATCWVESRCGKQVLIRTALEWYQFDRPGATLHVATFNHLIVLLQKAVKARPEALRYGCPGDVSSGIGLGVLFALAGLVLLFNIPVFGVIATALALLLFRMAYRSFPRPYAGIALPPVTLG